MNNLNYLNDLETRAFLEDPTCNQLAINCAAQTECHTTSMIRVIGDQVYIEQITGGSYGSDFFYVLEKLSEKLGYCCFVNVREYAQQFGGRRELLSTSRGGRRKWELIELPRKSLQGKAVLHVTFSNSGGVLFYLCRLDSTRVVCCLIDLTKECVQALTNAFCKAKSEDVVDYFRRCKVEERVHYVYEVLKERYKVEPRFSGERLYELFHSPDMALLTSLVIDTPQGRAISLGEKIARVAELWVLAKILDVLGGRALQEWWYIESTLNRELVVKDNRGRVFTIFYQGSLKPHILKMATGVEEHVVPDIVFVEGEIRNVPYGRLAQTLKNRGLQPLLVVEVKTGLELAKWRRASRLWEQVQSYQRELQPRHMAVVAVCSRYSGMPCGVTCVEEDKLENFVKEVFEL